MREKSSNRRFTTHGPIGVIGCSRGVGLKCVEYLVKNNLHCRAICRDPAAAEPAIRTALQSYGDCSKLVSFVCADVTQPSTLPAAVRGCCGVIFAASATVGWRLPFSEQKDTPPFVDYEGAVAAATAAASEAVPRFVLVSSLAVTRFYPPRSSRSHRRAIHSDRARSARTGRLGATAPSRAQNPGGLLRGGRGSQRRGRGSASAALWAQQASLVAPAPLPRP
mmetsp:Transcript_59478/g.158280  ORF Transcript_59478/g.158280 Transcript_59478/m.158280 type:complete len:222 (-) Transcript_59478:48-713(-)